MVLSARRTLLDVDAFDLIQAHFVGSSVVKLRAADGIVGCDLLSVFDATAVGEVGGDAGGPESVATDRA